MAAMVRRVRRAARPEVASARDKLSLAAARPRVAHHGGMDRDGLADFLRRRREALQPEDVGLGAGPAPPHAGPAARGGRGAGAHVDRLLHAARAAARLAAVGADDRRDRPRAAADARRARPPAPARRPRAAAARARAATTSARADARARPARHARPGRLRPRRHAAPEPAGRGAARRPDRLHRAAPQHVLPLVHRPGGARALPGRGPRAALAPLRRRPARASHATRRPEARDARRRRCCRASPEFARAVGRARGRRCRSRPASASPTPRSA